MNESIAYVGLEVHKDTIAVAVAYAGREEPVYHGIIAHTDKAVSKLIGRLSAKAEVVQVCYEAGPCGYGLYRQIVALGHGCEVVAPTLIPRKVGERVKTDRRGALMLTRLHRAGELSAVWVPEPEQEAMRDLTRAREVNGQAHGTRALAMSQRSLLSVFDSGHVRPVRRTPGRPMRRARLRAQRRAAPRRSEARSV